jgi:hypothetical protein
MFRSSLALVGGVVVLMAGCGAGTRDASDKTTGAATTTPRIVTSSASTSGTSTPPPVTTAVSGTGDLECLEGPWTLSAITGGHLDTRGFELAGVVRGVTVTFTPGTWKLFANDGHVGGDVAGANAFEVTFDGTAIGPVVSSGESIDLELQQARGDASASVPGGDELTFDYVIGGLIPAGPVTFTCGSTRADLTSGPSTLTLTRDRSPAPKVIDTSAIPVVEDCAGHPVTVIAAATDITLTGDCPTVTVRGTGNVVDVERVDSLIVTGTGNEITWESGITRPAPQVTAPGLANTIRHG